MSFGVGINLGVGFVSNYYSDEYPSIGLDLNAEYRIIPKMNHIFKEVEDIGLENSKTYNQHDLPVMPELIDAISDFIKN